jgi:hypothetical protein
MKIRFHVIQVHYETRTFFIRYLVHSNLVKTMVWQKTTTTFGKCRNYHTVFLFYCKFVATYIFISITFFVVVATKQENYWIYFVPQSLGENISFFLSFFLSIFSHFFLHRKYFFIFSNVCTVFCCFLFLPLLETFEKL